MVKQNIALENSREARIRQIEDRKKNRDKYRKVFVQLQRHFRKGKTLNFVSVTNKHLHDGVKSEFSLN